MRAVLVVRRDLGWLRSVFLTPADARRGHVAGLLIAVNWVIYVAAVVSAPRHRGVPRATSSTRWSPWPSASSCCASGCGALQWAAVAVGVVGGGLPHRQPRAGRRGSRSSLALLVRALRADEEAARRQPGRPAQPHRRDRRAGPGRRGGADLARADAARPPSGRTRPLHPLLLASSGVATAIPLLLFAAAARRVPLVTIGLLQFVTPDPAAALRRAAARRGHDDQPLGRLRHRLGGAGAAGRRTPSARPAPGRQARARDRSPCLEAREAATVSLTRERRPGSAARPARGLSRAGPASSAASRARCPASPGPRRRRRPRARRAAPRWSSPPPSGPATAPARSTCTPQVRETASTNPSTVAWKLSYRSRATDGPGLAAQRPGGELIAEQLASGGAAGHVPVGVERGPQHVLHPCGAIPGCVASPLIPVMAVVTGALSGPAMARATARSSSLLEAKQ